MTTEQIEEVKVLAVYMGIPKCDRCKNNCDHYKFGSAIFYKPQDMEYHTSWDWLMPVWQKFRDENIEHQKLNLATFKDKIELAIVYCDTPAAAASELAKAITWLQTIKK